MDERKPRRELTPEQKAKIQEILDRLDAGLCPQCGMKPERKKQIGRCVYAYPCGHRMYQGKLAPEDR